MNAADTIAAAIQKLEEWRKLPWPCEAWTHEAARHIARNCEIECPTGNPEHYEPDTWNRYETGPAIFGLSQTIDAQIRVLRLDARLREVHRPPYSGAALALAEAILGVRHD